MVGAGRASDAKVDPAGMQRLQRAELLGHHQRRVVGQHHATRADPDGRGRGSQVRQQHCRGRTRDGRHVVVLGYPESLIAPLLGVLGEFGGESQRLGGVALAAHRCEVENGERNVRHISRQPTMARRSSPLLPGFGIGSARE